MYETSPKFLKMFGLTSLDELPELPKYKLDENQQIIIDDVIEKNEQDNENVENVENVETENYEGETD